MATGLVATSRVENSDVLPSAAVAVAVMTDPAATPAGRVTENVPLPLAPVVTVAEPR